MDIQDELTTPGCPQCAIKHLAAALSYMADRYADADGRCLALAASPGAVCLCRAYINLGEVVIGYRSHLWFAVGLLQRAEEAALAWHGSAIAQAARTARLCVEERGREGVLEALFTLTPLVTADEYALAVASAHVAEAVRELPAAYTQGHEPPNSPGHVIEDIERIWAEYFRTDDLAAGTVPAEEQNKEKEGPTMATKKKAAACKGAKCAAKGGKTGKPAKKGCKK